MKVIDRRYIVLASVAAVFALVLSAGIVEFRLRGVVMPPGLGLGSGLPMPIGSPPEQATGIAKTGGPFSGLPVLRNSMPKIEGIASWLNSAPLTAADLKGKVVLVDFWTYSCINCIRTLPFITAWDKKYRDQGLVIIGVHTPEFSFEKNEANVRAALKQYGIAYPVALDNDYVTWDNFSNQYWPAKYLFDGAGRLRAEHFGEGDYDVTEKNIQALLAENGAAAATGTVSIAQTVDFSRIGSPETYLGYRRMELYGSPETLGHDRVQQYSAPASADLNRFYFEGRWIVGAESSSLAEAPGAVVYRYSASDANLVMGAESGTVLAEVTIDGAPVPANLRGSDIAVMEGKTFVRVSGERLYNLVSGHGAYAERTLRVRFIDAGARVYAFTFG